MNQRHRLSQWQMLSRRLIPFPGGKQSYRIPAFGPSLSINVYPTSIHPCIKKKKGKAFALVTRNGQQMLKSFTFLEESKQEASEESASTKQRKYNLRENKWERESFLLEARSGQLMLKSFTLLRAEDNASSKSVDAICLLSSWNILRKVKLLY